MKKHIFLGILSFCLSITLVIAQNKETRNVDSFTKIAFRTPGKLYLKQGTPQRVELQGDKDILKEIETEVEGGKLVIGKENGFFDWNWNDDDKIIVYITVPSLEAVGVSGSGDLIGESKFNSKSLDLNVSGSGSLSLEADVNGELEADVSGSGRIKFKGKCKSFDSDVSGSGNVSLDVNIEDQAEFGVSGSGRIEANGTANSVKTSISGSGKVLASNLEAKTCDIRISGSGDVEINVQNELNAVISGSGTVGYKGNPSKVNSNSSGSGKVRKI